jgi:hypothetical protein
MVNSDDELSFSYECGKFIVAQLLSQIMRLLTGSKHIVTVLMA